MLIFIAEKHEIHSAAIELLKNSGHTILFDCKDEDLLNIQAIFIRTYTKVDSELLNRFKNLKYILRAGVGTDNIDIQDVQRRNIQVVTSPGSNANSVAEFVIAMMLLLTKNINEQSKKIFDGEWRDKSLLGNDLKGKTLGIVGCGAIGRLLANKLSCFEMNFLGYDPYVDEESLQKLHIKKVRLDDLIKTSDIISLHLPLLQETKNLFTLKEFKMMKREVIFINTSRGGLVKENDLIQALNTGLIAKSAIDVFENEPHINKQLLTVKNLFLTPHIAAFTHESNLMMSLQTAENFIALV